MRTNVLSSCLAFARAGALRRVGLAACALLAVSAPALETVTRRDLPYVAADAQASAYARERCRLDVRVPVGVTGFPTVVWFHGGGLTGGSKHFIRIDGGIAQVAANYRLLQKDGSVTGDDCIDDAAAAVAWTLKNVARFGGDPKKVYVGGMSAGGYLTLMVGMDPSRLGKHGFRPMDLAGLAAVSGQATKHFNVRAFAGDRDPQYLPKIDRLAPLAFCSKDVPPLVCICGEPPWEWPGRAEENRLLVASCTALGHSAAYFVECAYCDHGRVFTAAQPYVEMFVLDRLPDRLRLGARR